METLVNWPKLLYDAVAYYEWPSKYALCLLYNQLPEEVPPFFIQV